MKTIETQLQPTGPEDTYGLRPFEPALQYPFTYELAEAIEDAPPPGPLPPTFWALREVAHWHSAAQLSSMCWFWKSRWEAGMDSKDRLNWEKEARAQARTFLSREQAWKRFCMPFSSKPHRWLISIPGVDVVIHADDDISEFMGNTELKRASFKPSEKAISLMLQCYSERFRKVLARRGGSAPELKQSKSGPKILSPKRRTS